MLKLSTESINESKPVSQLDTADLVVSDLKWLNLLYLYLLYLDENRVFNHSLLLFFLTFLKYELGEERPSRTSIVYLGQDINE